MIKWVNLRYIRLNPLEYESSTTIQSKTTTNAQLMALSHQHVDSTIHQIFATNSKTL